MITTLLLSIGASVFTSLILWPRISMLLEVRRLGRGSINVQHSFNWNGRICYSYNPEQDEELQDYLQTYSMLEYRYPWCFKLAKLIKMI